MIFSSTVFLLLFLPVVLGLYLLAPRWLKNPVLLIASLVFYFWGERFFVLVMLASILGNFVFGILIDRSRGRPSAFAWLTVAVALNLALLFVYKYSAFCIENLNLLLAHLGASPLTWGGISRLPIGISFFTFQAISYVVDVYREDARAQRNPLNVSLYIALFPQLIAGPIVRYQQIEKQLVGRKLDLEGFAAGIRRFVVGLGKKVLIATPLEMAADSIYALPSEELSAPLAWLGAFTYTIQLYHDFSGYSDMAIGLGQMFAFRFPENFKYPYYSRSIRELWRRWHMSLTTWFRDYVYIPMGGNRGGELRTWFNLVTIFFLCGVWHGAQWTFIVFGFYHGLFLGIERLPWLAFFKRTPVPLQYLYTFFFWMVGLIIFRSSDMGQAASIYAGMFGLSGGASVHTVWEFLTPELLLTLPIGVVGALPFVPRAWNRYIAGAWEPGATPARVGSAALLSTFGTVAVLVFSVIYMAASTHNPFIYFRF